MCMRNKCNMCGRRKPLNVKVVGLRVDREAAGSRMFALFEQQSCRIHPQLGANTSNKSLCQKLVHKSNRSAKYANQMIIPNVDYLLLD